MSISIFWSFLNWFQAAAFQFWFKPVLRASKNKCGGAGLDENVMKWSWGQGTYIWCMNRTIDSEGDWLSYRCLYWFMIGQLSGNVGKLSKMAWESCNDEVLSAGPLCIRSIVRSPSGVFWMDCNNWTANLVLTGSSALMDKMNWLWQRDGGSAL